VIEVAPTPAAVPHSTHEVATAAAKSDDVLGSLVNDLESALGDDFAIGGVAAAPHIPAPAPAAATMSAAAYATPTPAPTAAPAPIAAAPSPVATSPAPAAEASKDASLLDDLFDEFKQEMGETSDHSVEDPDTHYNLGVAFKEMGLLDEAIGELQKVCQAIDHGLPFPQTMQAYTWLAHCFVEKGVPEASFMWFDRALSVAKDNDTRAAILYELGSAYEMASQREKAREAFTNVMSINIDFRDVGERIKALKS
jgi:tetratricopeptide (TPR) repeat protein